MKHTKTAAAKTLLLSLNKVKTAGSQCLCGFPFSMLAKCLQFLKEIGRKHLIKVIILGNRFPNHTWHQE